MELNASNNNLKANKMDNKNIDTTPTPSTKQAAAIAPYNAMDVLAVAASKSPTAASLAKKPDFSPDDAPTITTAASHTGKDIAITAPTAEAKKEAENGLAAVVDQTKASDDVDQTKVTTDVPVSLVCTREEKLSTVQDKEEDTKSDEALTVVAPAVVAQPAAVPVPVVTSPADSTPVAATLVVAPVVASNTDTPITEADTPEERVETLPEEVTLQDATPTITPVTNTTTGSHSAAPVAVVPTTTATPNSSDTASASSNIDAAATTSTTTPTTAATLTDSKAVDEGDTPMETPATTTAEAGASIENATTAAAEDDEDDVTESKMTEDDSHAEKPTAGDHAATATGSQDASSATIKSEQHSPAAALSEASATSAAASASVSAATPAPATRFEQIEADEGPPEAPPPPAPLRPALRGKLQLGSKGVAEWHGEWGMDDDAFQPGGFLSKFMYKYTRAAPAQRGVTPPPVPLALPLQLKDGYFSGFFMMGSTVPGGAVVRVDERNVLLRFSPHGGQGHKDEEGMTDASTWVKVHGSGKNKFGAFVLDGEMNTEALTLNVYREYKVRTRKRTPASRRSSLAPPSTALKSGASNYGAYATPGPDSNVVGSGSAVPPPTAGLIPRGLQFEGDDSLLYSSSRSRPERMRRMPSHLNLDSSNPLAKVSTLLSEMVASDKERYFCIPVDPIALGIPDYFTVVKEPMDLGTVMKNVAEKVYQDEDEVLDHIRLTYQNAMTFNPVSHQIHKMAADYLQAFENKWDKILMDRVRDAERSASRRKANKTAGSSSRKRKGDDGMGASVTGSVSSRKRVKKSSTKKSKKKGTKKSSKKRRKTDSSDEENSSDEASSDESDSEAETSESDSSEDESSSDEGSSDEEGGSRKRKKGKEKKKKKKSRKTDQIRELQRQLDRLKKPDTKKKKKKKLKTNKKTKTGTKTPARRTSTGGAGSGGAIVSAAKSKKKSTRAQRPMSYQEKRTLGNDIRKCSSDQVNRVISIIRENGGHLGGSGDEVELDIDALDTKIQWLLHAFVRKCLLHSDPHPGVNHEDEDSY